MIMIIINKGKLKKCKKEHCIKLKDAIKTTV